MWLYSKQSNVIASHHCPYVTCCLATMTSRAVTIYQYVVILQYDVVQHNSIHLLQRISKCWQIYTYTCSSCYWFSKNHICIALQQYSVNILHAICNIPICGIVTALMTSSVYTTAQVYQHHGKLINPCSLFLSTNGLEYSLLALQGLCIRQWSFFSSLHVAFSQEPRLLKVC